MDLRDYQTRCVESVEKDLEEVDSVLIVKATGLGKTVTFSHLAKRRASLGRVMVLAHREELIRQAAEKVGTITNELPEIEMASEWADQPNLLGIRSNVVVSSIQTQISGCSGNGRMTRFDPADFGTLIIDEAHHAAAESYRRVIAYYRQNPKLKVIGVTATPDRADELALGKIFDRVSFVYEIADGISDGWLAPISQRIVTVDGLDFSTVRTTAGDLNGADLSAIMEYEQNLHGIAHPTYELAAGRKTLMFAASVSHAERLCEIFNRHKADCARFISGQTDDVTRKRALRDFRGGELQFLVNCMVFTEGFDEPSIQVVAIARPTKSRALYTQMVGRGTRPLPGVVDGLDNPEERIAAIAASDKPGIEVLDFEGNAGRHKLMTTADILGGKYPEAIVEATKKKASKAKQPVNVQMLLAQVAAEEAKRQQEADQRRQLEAAKRVQLVGKANYSTQTVNAFDILDITPAYQRGWDKAKPASDKQIELLRRFGVQNAAELSKSECNQLIGTLLGRSKANLCSVAQAALLQRMGWTKGETKSMTKKQASQNIELGKANGYKRPSGELSSLVGASEGRI